MLNKLSRSQRVKDWRKRTKERMVKSMGGSCQCCSYDKCNQALELHHLDPNKKELSFGSVMANPTRWDSVVIELRKCILVCSNCHKEIHAGVRQIPEKFAIFDESFVDYKPQIESHDECPVCHNPKPKVQLTCSYRCACLRKGCVNWDLIDLAELKKTLSNTAIATQLGISESAVRKRWMKLAPAPSIEEG